MTTKRKNLRTLKLGKMNFWNTLRRKEAYMEINEEEQRSMDVKTFIENIQPYAISK